jgi:hypothetical protein
VPVRGSVGWPDVAAGVVVCELEAVDPVDPPPPELPPDPPELPPDPLELPPDPPEVDPDPCPEPDPDDEVSATTTTVPCMNGWTEQK